MTSSDDRRSPNARPADALDAFLDDLTHGDRSDRHALAPGIADTARRLRGLADATLAANIAPGDEARTWEALMRGRPSRPQLVTRPSAVRPSPSRTVIPIPPSRLRRVGSQSLGLVATLTLVALIGLSGLAVYLTAPQRDDPATAAVVAAASPTAVATISTADSQEIVYQPCDVTPRDYDDLMEMVANQVLVPQPDVPFARGRTDSMDPGGPRFRLPEGSPVSVETQADVVDRIGTWLNCTPFLQAAVSTDDYLVRRALDGPLTGWSTFSWWLYSHPDLAPVRSEERDAMTGVVIDPAASELAPVGTSPLIYAYGFRRLDDWQVAAYLASPIVQSDNEGLVPSYTALSDPLYEEHGYIVLEQQPDGQWLVEELVLTRRGPDTPCGSSCATPIAP